MHRIELLRGEQERAELGAVHPVALGLGDLGPADVLGGVGGDAAVDVCEAVVAAHGRQAPVDRRRGQSPLLHRHPVQLDVRPGGRQRFDAVVGRPLEERAEIVPVGVERAAAVADEERKRSELSLVGNRAGHLKGVDGD